MYVARQRYVHTCLCGSAYVANRCELDRRFCGTVPCLRAADSLSLRTPVRRMQVFAALGGSVPPARVFSCQVWARATRGGCVVVSSGLEMSWKVMWIWGSGVCGRKGEPSMWAVRVVQAREPLHG